MDEEEKRPSPQPVAARKETHTGTLRVGDIEVECGVLEDGTRVFSKRGMGRAFGAGKTGVNHGAPKIPPFLASKAVSSCISADLMERLESPLRYRPKQGGRDGWGYPAGILREICEVLITVAAASGKPTDAMRLRGAIATALLSGLAEVGVNALIDEATGYQYERSRTALAEILEGFIAKELAVWVKRFPDEYYDQLARLRGVTLSSGDGIRRYPQYFGHLTNNIVYARLAPGVLEELQRINPSDGGGRKAKHHQWLTKDTGHPKLREHMAVVIALMRISPNYASFQRKLDKASPQFGTTGLLPWPEFDDD